MNRPHRYYLGVGVIAAKVLVLTACPVDGSGTHGFIDLTLSLVCGECSTTVVDTIDTAVVGFSGN